MDDKPPIGIKMRVNDPTNDPKIDKLIAESILYDRELFAYSRQIQIDVRNTVITVTTQTELPEGVLTEIAQKIQTALRRKGLTLQDTTYTVTIPQSLTKGPEEVQ